MAPTSVSSHPKPSLAVIGAGLAGLSAAWLLSQKYTVTLYERHSQAGMGVFTSDYQSNGIHTRIDVPLRIFTPNYYPNLFSLYRHLDIEMEPSDHAGVFQYLTPEGNLKVFFQYRNFKIFSYKFRFLDVRSLSLTGFRLVVAQARFFKRIEKDVNDGTLSLNNMTFSQYLSLRSFNRQFVQHMLMPALAVTLTCDFESVGNYPADIILEYLTCGVMEQGIVRAKQGVDGIVPKITQGYEVRCHHEVQRVQQHESGVTLMVNDLEQDSVFEKAFDQVVIASQADIAAAMLATQEKNSTQLQQRALLQRIPLETSIMVLHTDKSLISKAGKGSPVSYAIAQNESRAATSVDLTKAFSTYQGQQPVFQTWHPIKQPAPQSIIQQAQFSRPLVTMDSREAVTQLQALNENSRLKICGSYMVNRFPLLDAAVESSVCIARQLGVTIPWEMVEENAASYSQQQMVMS